MGRIRSLRSDSETATFRLLALGSVLVLVAAYVSVLREVTRVVGGTQTLLAVVGVSILVATILARAIRPRSAAVLALLAGAGGFAYYLEAAGVRLDVLGATADDLVADAITLAAGQPLLQMVAADVWTVAFAPAPAFLSWYLVLRGRYAASVLPAGFALGFLVLTGDAGTTVTLLGSLAAIAAVGFGELERRNGSLGQVDLLAVLLAVVLVLSLTVSFVPSGPTTASTPGTGEAGTLEGTIDASPERSGIAGSVDLSPEVRFTVESEQPTYWRTGVYDRYTGSEWLRSGQESPLEDTLRPPPGEYDLVEQQVRAETELGVTPVAAEPIDLRGSAVEDATVTSHGQVHPGSALAEGETYTVQSAVVDPDPGELRRAGTDYPDEVEDYYLQRPETTSSAFDERTAEIAAEAETPFETAVAIEHYLRNSKEYSLEVDRPTGDVAETFLLEMDAGYCVYYATTMVQMLRAEDVPARYATGYTAGEQVDEDTYEVRGLDAHAWVEVYFPGHGWVPFEPTPPADREVTHEAHADVGTDSSLADDPDGTDSPADDDGGESEDDPGVTDDDRVDPADREDDDAPSPEDEQDSVEDDDGMEPADEGDSGDDGEESGPIVVPTSWETVALLAVALVGLAAFARHTDGVHRFRRGIGRYWHGPRGDPDRDAERAFRRLEWLLADAYRPRRPGESPRAYLRALEAAAATEETVGVASEPRSTNGAGDNLVIDPRVRTVFACRERAVYGEGVDRASADAAIRAVDDLARERSRLPFPGRGQS
ncbi:transglutaminase [Natrarchaeobaculum aegyptiacum]|uniref:Transglutaminase n=2 Tax=Natrarchaeobaculum aegyptiacum TaxID=745377 RepID=A0A2Z2HX42_9EURY|nr:transglutaminase [Natrarchaeobaculum aegyptiacum]